MNLKGSITSLVLIIALLLSGCGIEAKTADSITGAGDAYSIVDKEGTPGNISDEDSDPDSGDAAHDSSEQEVTEPLPSASEEMYQFNPHVYSPMLSKYYSQEWWDSFYSLCDALREGRDTFECVSQEAYDWCMDDVTLADLFPPACVVIKRESNDGTVPFENGIGRIYYGISPEEYIVRQAGFEAMIVEILNSVLEPDDTDFEKCMKLYAYMESTYTYGNIEFSGDGYTYATLLHKKGVCENLSGVYVYLLLQVGVDALNIGCFNEIQHAWTYVLLDGEGYHIDPTWGLHDEGDPLILTYFLNSERVRNDQGVPTDDLTAGMVPRFWLSFTETVLPATSEKYACLQGATFVSLDEENKILYYEDDMGTHALQYE